MRILVEQAKEKGQPLYVCYVNLRKALDHVPKTLLWRVHKEAQIPPAFIRATQLMYQYVYVVICTADGSTNWFLSNLGER